MKITRHVKAPAGKFGSLSARFEHVHMDIVGPLPPSQGYRYVLTCVDRFTRWPEAYPLRNTDAIAIARTFYAEWVSRFGTPLRITTDQGRQFEATLFSELNQLLGTKHFRTCAYHPEANGMVERFHRTLKTAIRCHETARWTEILPTILLGIRSAWKEDLAATSAELVYGEPVRLPGEFLNESSSNGDTSEYLRAMREHFAQLRPIDGTKHGTKKTFMFKDLKTASHVFVRRDSPKCMFEPPYEGPYKVLERGANTIVVETHGKPNTISINRTKPAYVTTENPTAAEKEDGATPTPTTTRTITRSGRHVRFPDKLAYNHRD